MVPIAPIITRIISVFTFHTYWLPILKSSQLLSLSHFCLQELQHPLTSMFPVYCHGLRCPVCCWEQFCRFTLSVP
jgi:hypothetical protein